MTTETVFQPSVANNKGHI